MWLFPYLTYFAIVAMVAVIGAMALVEDVRAQLIPSFISLSWWWAPTRSRPVPNAARQPCRPAPPDPRAGSLGHVLIRMHDEDVAG